MDETPMEAVARKARNRRCRAWRAKNVKYYRKYQRKKYKEYMSDPVKRERLNARMREWLRKKRQADKEMT